jgi:hypothetical protein
LTASTPRSLHDIGLGESRIDFEYRGHAFTVDDQLGEYRFLVADPSCPRDVLDPVAEHASRILAS